MPDFSKSLIFPSVAVQAVAVKTKLEYILHWEYILFYYKLSSFMIAIWKCKLLEQYF